MSKVKQLMYTIKEQRLCKRFTRTVDQLLQGQTSLDIFYITSYYSYDYYKIMKYPHAADDEFAN